MWRSHGRNTRDGELCVRCIDKRTSDTYLLQLRARARNGTQIETVKNKIYTIPRAIHKGHGRMGVGHRYDHISYINGTSTSSTRAHTHTRWEPALARPGVARGAVGWPTPPVPVLRCTPVRLRTPPIPTRLHFADGAACVPSHTLQMKCLPAQ